MIASIVVAHAGRQYSHQLAAALHARGALHEYWTGLPLDRNTGVGVWFGRLHPGAAYAAAELPADRVRVLPVATAAHALERRLRPGLGESFLGQWGDYVADWAYSRWLRAAPPVSAVVGYENACLATFRAARARGIRTILDAASVHHAAADRWMGAPAATGWARDVRGHKDQELDAADHVLVLSELARETYAAAGVPPARISVVPLGYDPAVFSTTGEPRVGEPLQFVFVGNAGYRKGFDVLLDSVARLGAAGARWRLAVIGDIAAVRAHGVELRGKLSQAAIAQAYAQADCLILPSRCDSFGMVVAEALGSGLPSIVSEHVGAKDLVVESAAGWVVPPANAEALAKRMHWCIEHPDVVLEAKRKARAAASAWTWERYRARVADTVIGLLAHG